MSRPPDKGGRGGPTRSVADVRNRDTCRKGLGGRHTSSGVCLDPQRRGEARGLVTGRDCLNNPPADSMLRSRETSPGRTNAHKQLVRPSPLGSSVDVRVECSHRTHTVKLHLIWIPKGRRMEGLQYYWPWCSSGDLRGVTRSRVQKCFRQSGRKVKIGRGHWKGLKVTHSLQRSDR